MKATANLKPRNCNREPNSAKRFLRFFEKTYGIQFIDSHCQNMGCTRMEQIGKRHRMSFAASLKHFAPKTQHDYRLAVDKLMELHRSSHLNLQPYKQGKTPTSQAISE